MKRMLLLIGLFAILGAEPALKDEDPLPVDTTWKGKLTQTGTHPQATFPPELQAELTVTKRDGDAASHRSRRGRCRRGPVMRARERVSRNPGFRQRGIRLCEYSDTPCP